MITPVLRFKAYWHSTVASSSFLSCATIRVYPERPMVVTVHIGSQVTAVAGAGLEPAISAYETERITIFHIPQYKIKDPTKRLLGFMNLIVVRTRFELVTLP